MQKTVLITGATSGIGLGCARKFAENGDRLILTGRNAENYAQEADIKWNFTKFLVSRDGRVVKRYEPTDKMSDVEAGISQELNPTR